MEQPTLKAIDALVVPVAVLVLFYHLFVVQRPIQGVLLATWILGVYVSFRIGGREHALVTGGLGASVLVGYYSANQVLYFTMLVLAGFAYTIWTVKYAPLRRARR